MTKTCKSCGKDKPFTAEFFVRRLDRPRGSGLRGKCLECESIKNAEWVSRPEVKRRRNAMERERYRDPKRVQRKARYMYQFGMTIEDYDTLLEKQGGVCAVCKGEQSPPERRFCIDHCHLSGNVRGLLCFSCNVAIGHFRDSEDLMLSAIKYLRANENVVSVSLTREDGPVSQPHPTQKEI